MSLYNSNDKYKNSNGSYEYKENPDNNVKIKKRMKSKYIVV